MIETILVSLKVALAASVVSVLPATLLSFCLARFQFHGKILIQTVLTLPMVLPPVAVGFFLLHLLSKNGPLGRLDILFTWKAAAIASTIMSFPLFVRPLEQAFRAVPRRLEQVGRSLGKSPLYVFLTITLPLAKNGFLYGLILFFLRALGEFGATSIVAGNLPGETQTLALAIYSSLENFDDQKALSFAMASLLIAASATFAAEIWLRREP